MSTNTPDTTTDPSPSTLAAVEAFRRGITPIPIRDGGKKPHGGKWQATRWESEEQVTAAFERWNAEGIPGLGLVLGETSNGLVDVDLDHPRAARLRDYFLPPTAMRSGRPGSRFSHYWYRVEEGDDVPPTRRYKMPNGEVSVEIRGTGSQTLVPPSIWYPKEGSAGVPEAYRWEGEAWGGEEGPTVVNGQVLSCQVALLGMAAVLLDGWPMRGSRHDAYLALAGALLRYPGGVHPWWERNLGVLIGALASVTDDDDGPDARVDEVMGTTIKRLREGGEVTGWPSLGQIIGAEHADMARRWSREVESWGTTVRRDDDEHVPPSLVSVMDSSEEEDSLITPLPPRERNPLDERSNTWESVDLDPYLSGDVVPTPPTVLTRSDGHALFYPGRVNSLYGPSESGKTWIAIEACVQEIGKGERVVYLDFEDEPSATVDRLRRLGVGSEDVAAQFRYVHPEGPLADMQRNRYGSQTTSAGRENTEVFAELLRNFDPTLIIADGMTSLYGLHGHDTNDASGTDVVTTWLKGLCRGGRTTVIVIDHTGKNSGAGASPIGAHHKIAMIQGCALRVDVVTRPLPGGVGEIRLMVFKDRLGQVRRVSEQGQGKQEPCAGVVTVDSREDRITRLTIEPADPREVMLSDGSAESTAAVTKTMLAADHADDVLRLFNGDVDKEIKTKDVIAALGLSDSVVWEVWRVLIARGEVEMRNSSKTHRSYGLRRS